MEYFSEMMMKTLENMKKDIYLYKKALNYLEQVMLEWYYCIYKKGYIVNNY